MKQSHKTLLWWTLLVLMLVAIYQIFTADPRARWQGKRDGEQASPVLTPQAKTGWRTGALVVGSIIGLTALLTFMQRRKARLFNEPNQRGITLLEQRKLDEAAAIFEDLVARYTLEPYGLVGHFNLAITRVRQGRHEEALAALRIVEQHKEKTQLAGRVAEELANASVLVGDLDGCEQWLKQAEARRGAASADSALLAEGALWCRRGLPEEATRLIEERWRRAESVLSGESLKQLRLVWAFSVHQQGLKRIGSTDERRVQELIAGLKPFDPGEHDAMARNWPELRGFLEENGFSRTSPRSAHGPTSV